jgi:20S proteasome subunit alpha 6
MGGNQSSALGSLEELIKHGLHALRETLQQDKELTIQNTSIGITGAPSEHEQWKTENFRILEGDKIDVFLKSMTPKEVVAPAEVGGADEDVQMGE